MSESVNTITSWSRCDSAHAATKTLFVCGCFPISSLSGSSMYSAPRSRRAATVSASGSEPRARRERVDGGVRHRAAELAQRGNAQERLGLEGPALDAEEEGRRHGRGEDRARQRTRSLRKCGSGAAFAGTSIGAMTTALSELDLIASGKVREMYALEDDIVMVASDRISAYDVILPTPIPDKGRVLSQMSVFWFESTGSIVPNHFISQDVPPEAEGRGLRVKRLEMYPVECVVRGYITGSGWREYKESGSVCGIELPEGLRSPTSCRSRSSPPRPRRRWATTTRTSRSSAPSRSSATAR